MRPILVVNHLHGPETGLVDDALRGEGLPVVAVNIFDDPRLPALEEISGIVSLGGMMGVPDSADYPFLSAELELLADALAAETPILGLCLGAQLLARAAGGEVRRLARLYVGWPELVALPPAGEDPLFHRLPGRTVVLEWHRDTIEPPPGATVLAETEGPGCAVFRAGPAAWGSQIHLELTPEMLAGWLSDPAQLDGLEAVGVDVDAFVREAPARLRQQGAVTGAVIQEFARFVRRYGAS
ncbi:MAG TPA: type 1 glutamine amidotransferase [Gaiellaceae bacterium]|nr:type 1 glutamine amidotransferase [Gaiellaceae bacterium]